MSLDQVKYIRISPGIGMARVGNSDTDFIGPETPGIPPAPQNGEFKDAEGKVKPMSARFRVYGYNLLGEAIMELNLDNPDVTELDWQVHMANKKAANYAFQGKFGFKSSDLRNPGVQPGLPPDERDQLIIDPGVVSISGKSQPRKPMTANIFDGKVNGPIQGTVPIPKSNFLGHYGETGNIDVSYSPLAVTIGWLKTDDSGRLVIVGGRGEAGSLTNPSTIIQKGPGSYNEASGGGLNTDPNSNGNLYFNNPGWYDDTGGGSVNASVTFNTTTGPVTLTSMGSQTLGNGVTIDEKNKRAWIGVAPPKFVPSMANVVSLADLQYNIFPEKDPAAGSIYAATFGQNGEIDLHHSAKGTTFVKESIVLPPARAYANPAITSYNNHLFCAFNSVGSGVPNVVGLAISDDPTDPSKFNYYFQTTDVQTDFGPSIIAYNSKIICAVVANSRSASQFANQVVIGQTTVDDRTTFTFNPITLKLATPTGFEDFGFVPIQSVAISAYNGQLYLAFSVNGESYLGVPSTTVAFQFNMQRVGQTGITNNLPPSIAAYDGRLYYAITDSTNTVQYGSLNLNGPQKPLNPSATDKTPPFDITFQPVNGAVPSNLGPAISEFNGKLYCLVVDSLSGSVPFKSYLYTKTPLLHLNATGKVDDVPPIEQEPPFSAAVASFDSGDAQPALCSFETVNFYRDILPVLKTVTDYAYVNELAFDGHGPATQANFVRSTYESSLGNPDSANITTRNHVFQFIRPGEWVTEVPPPPNDFENSIVQGESTIVPAQEDQQGSLMPHLAGTGGSVDENIFNGTKYPGQWLSLTRHQLAKFQKWVNGQFITGTPLPAPTPVDDLPVGEQPDKLDLAALELTVGGGFHPGIELTYYMAYPEYFCEPFRFTDSIAIQSNPPTSVEVTPGSIAGYMSIPWHGDFWSCNTDFWPPQRPDIVVQDIDGVPTPVNWFRSSALQIPETASSVTKWLHGENPDHFDGNHTTYQTFLRYWSYFGFVTVPTSPPLEDEQEQIRVETERNSTCLDGPTPPTCPAVNPVASAPTAEKALTVENGRFTLRGKILRNNLGVEGLHVEAFDHDHLSKDDKLGNATTGADGSFSIQFNQSDFSSWGMDKRPDVYFKIYKDEELILTTKDKVIRSLDELRDLLNINLP